jgi:hypothetical protein
MNIGDFGDINNNFEGNGTVGQLAQNFTPVFSTKKVERSISPPRFFDGKYSRGREPSPVPRFVFWNEIIWIDN